MSFSSLSEFIAFIENQMAVNFYGPSATLRKGVLKILASVIGASLYMFSLVAKKIWKNRFVSTCDIDYLNSFGSEYGIPHKPPVYATGYIQLSVDEGRSVSIPSGTYFVDPLTNNEYYTISDESVSDKSQIRVIAAVAGDEKNLSADTVLQFRDATPNYVDDEVVVVDGIVGGQSVEVVIDGNTEYWGETAEEFRKRILDRVRNPPQGGSKNDYKSWAERFNFVTNAFVIPHKPNVNSIVVALANFSSGNNDDPGLDSAKVAEVKSYITADERRPITADVRVMSVTKAEFTVNAKVAPFTDSVKQSVTNAIKAVLQKIGPSESITKEDVQVQVLANSTASTFKIDSISKNSSSVNEFTLELKDLDSDTPVAEVAVITANLSSGEE